MKLRSRYAEQKCACLTSKADPQRLGKLVATTAVKDAQLATQRSLRAQRAVLFVLPTGAAPCRSMGQQCSCCLLLLTTKHFAEHFPFLVKHLKEPRAGTIQKRSVMLQMYLLREAVGEVPTQLHVEKWNSDYDNPLRLLHSKQNRCELQRCWLVA